MTSPFIFIPISLYLLFSGLFIQQGLSNFFLRRSGLTPRRGHLLYFTIACAVFCLSLLTVLLAPILGFSPTGIRWAFFGCWLVAPIVGYLYVLALAQHLDISFKKIRWFTAFYVLDFCSTVACGIYTGFTGKGLLFAHERGATQSLIDIHLGGAFSPNGVTLVKVILISCLVSLSSIFFLRVIFRKPNPDLSLVAGILLTAVALVAELVAFVLQWPMAFSILPLANAVEVVRLTYLQTLEAGRSMELERQTVRRDRIQMQSYLKALSHDVRTPLTSLKVGLSRDVSGEGFDALRQELALEIEYLHVVFSNIVTFFELELADHELVWRETDIRSGLTAAVSRFSGLARERGLTVSVSDEPDALSIICDPSILEQALSNLVYNALIHARSQIAVSAFLRADEVVVRVLDDGPGFELDCLPDMKDRGYRALLEKHVQCPGWGLGLTISHALASVSNGHLSVGLGDGDTMSVEFSLPSSKVAV